MWGGRPRPPFLTLILWWANLVCFGSNEFGNPNLSGVILRDFSPEGSCAQLPDSLTFLTSAPRQMLRKLSMTPLLDKGVKFG